MFSPQQGAGCVPKLTLFCLRFELFGLPFFCFFVFVSFDPEY